MTGAGVGRSPYAGAMTSQESSPEAAPAPGRHLTSLSPSRAGDFMTCPLLYRYRVIDKIPEPPSAAATRGTVVHLVLERLYDLPATERTLDRATQLLPAAWDDVVAADAALTQLASAAETAADVGTWLDGSPQLLATYFAMEDPTRLEPAEREYQLSVELPSGLTLRGFVDRLDVAPDGAMRVVDYKTGRSPGEGFEQRALFQMRFYALALWRSRGEVPRLLQLMYLGDGGVVRYEPDEQDLLSMERKVEALWAAVRRANEQGIWPPRKSRLCDWCNHKSRCPEWGGTIPPIPPHGPPVALSDDRPTAESSAADV